MAELWFIYEEIVRQGAIRRERVFRDRENPLEVYNDLELLKKFGLPGSEIKRLVDLLGPRLTRNTNRNNPLPPIIQIVTALRFYAKGGLQADNGDKIKIQQSSVCRCIKRVTDLLCEMIGDFVKFPTVEELQAVKQQFSDIAGFPEVIGVIDGTLVPLKSPGGLREIAFYSRKGFHSINVQVICDARMAFRDVVVKWPGSTHDAFMWLMSGRRQQLVANPKNGLLLGDSSYPLEPWLMTPLKVPGTQAEKRYNSALIRTRQVVKFAIGLLKSRFRCLHKSSGTLLYTPERTIKIIIACIILHNMRRGCQIPYDEDLNDLLMDDDDVDEEDEDERDSIFENPTGQAVQLSIIEKLS